MDERGIAEVNGTRLVYETAGSGPPVVFLHGFTLDMRMWDGQMAPFAAAHRVVRYDLRGFGGEGRHDEAKAIWLAAPTFAGSRRLPPVAARLEQMVADYGCWELLHENPHRPLDPPPIDRLAEIAAPTLIVLGEEDLPDFHEIADRCAAEIRGAQGRDPRRRAHGEHGRAGGVQPHRARVPRRG